MAHEAAGRQTGRAEPPVTIKNQAATMPAAFRFVRNVLADPPDVEGCVKLVGAGLGWQEVLTVAAEHSLRPQLLRALQETGVDPWNGELKRRVFGG